MGFLDLFARNISVCPIDADQRAWIDGRYAWLEEHLGETFPPQSPIILPTSEFFPDPYHGQDADAEKMLSRVAGYMKVDPNRLKLYIFSDGTKPDGFGGPVTSVSSAAGLYHRTENPDEVSMIGIEAGQLAEPMSLVATLAHEVGHEILLGQNRVAPDQQDHEPLTDLLVVFSGMGIFSANSTVGDRGWSAGGWAGWQTKRQGYLDQKMFGYALARFAHARGDDARPSWMKHVRPDVRKPMQASLRCLNQSPTK